MAADHLQPFGADRGAVDAGNSVDRITRQLAEADAPVAAVNLGGDRIQALSDALIDRQPQLAPRAELLATGAEFAGYRASMTPSDRTSA